MDLPVVKKTSKKNSLVKFKYFTLSYIINYITNLYMLKPTIRPT